ncbi:uncharacterized protein LOC6560555 [Drosophila grimshawi]|uniref:uncharacterized protein LOC6560555 n=1 Tax=Drosophila grimshawi TaxID=7222 RepID=UPI0013EF2239|nr:uncharacterized protein LOC6560555 [Drosophila grimshawi]
MPSRKTKKRANALAEQVVQQERTQTGESELVKFFRAFDAESNEVENNPKPIPEPGSESNTTAAATAALTAATTAAPSPDRDPESLLNYNFLRKLHLAASSKQINFINWSGDGQLLQLSYIGLQDYLFSDQSIFRCRSVAQLVSQLYEVGFQAVERHSEPQDNFQMYFQHKHFKPHQQEMLICINTPECELEVETPVIDEVAKDPCTMIHGSCSRLQMTRMRFNTLLNYQNDVRQLQQQEHKTEEQLPRRGRIGSNRQLAESLLPPALEAIYLNPQDSESNIEVDHVPDYAGYYGNVNPSLIHGFFGEYLPHYGPRNTAGHSDIVVEVSKANAFQQNLPIGILHSEDEDDPVAKHEETNTTNNDDNSQLPADNSNPLPEDIELEQMMDDLWGSGADSQPKVKRGKLVENCAENKTVPDDLKADTANETESGEDLLQSAAAAVDVKDDSGINTNANGDIDNDSKEDLESQPELKIASKRRRYDLRHSKPKRSN